MGLSTYIIQRILITIPTFLGITLIVFGLIQMAPGNIVDFYMSANPETRMDMEKVHLRQAAKFLKSFVPELGLPRPCFSLVIGIVSAIKPNSLVDHLGRAGALIGLSLPAFWIGMALILLFGVRLRWFPIGGSLSIGTEDGSLFFLLRNRLWHLILPSAAIALQSIATTMRLTRAEMLEVLKKDYITAARAKGLTERKIYLKHALRNSLMPVVTMIGLSMGHIFSGAVLTETVFSWPGIGRYLTYHWINPKVRY